MAINIQNYIESLNPELKPIATFHQNYVRRGSIFDEGENGILLNSDAMKILIDHALNLISELTIRQAKAYMYVDELVVDYNDSSRMMRIKRDESEISSSAQAEFASYFYAK